MMVIQGNFASQRFHRITQSVILNPWVLLQSIFFITEPKRLLIVFGVFSTPWWRWWDSNPWPPACRAGALPAELHPHKWLVVILLFPLQGSFFGYLSFQRKCLVGPSGLEPPTSCLSGTRSNLLSYEPMWLVSDFFSLELNWWDKDRSSVLISCVSIELSSRAVSRKVFSPLQSLTSVFGMGTGGPSAFVTLTIQELFGPWILNNIHFAANLSVNPLTLSIVKTLQRRRLTRCTFSIERRWSSRTFRYGYLVTT